MCRGVGCKLGWAIVMIMLNSHVLTTYFRLIRSSNTWSTHSATLPDWVACWSCVSCCQYTVVQTVCIITKTSTVLLHNCLAVHHCWLAQAIFPTMCQSLSVHCHTAQQCHSMMSAVAAEGTSTKVLSSQWRALQKILIKNYHFCCRKFLNSS